MVQYSFPALGTKWWIEIFDTSDNKSLAAAFGRCQGFVETFEANYSRFKLDSKLSLLNQKGFYPQPDGEWRNILTLGQTLFTRTNETFNILHGHILNNRGYDKDYSFMANDAPEIFYHPLRDLSVTPERVTLHHGQVDIGGFGKGYAIDRVKEILLESGFNYFLINGGGDMYASTDHGQPIAIYLEHPLQSDTYLSETTLLNQGFAASSPFKRQWRSNDATYSHIVSKYPLPLTATFTKAQSAVLADAFATTALLLPKDQLLTLAAQNEVAIAQFDPILNEIWYTQTF